MWVFDADWDSLGDLAAELNIDTLEDRFKARMLTKDFKLSTGAVTKTAGSAIAAGTKDSKPDMSDEEIEDRLETGLSIWEPEFPDIVRDYLDKGVLAATLEKQKKEKDYFSMCYLVACAMALGCTFRPKFLKYFRRVYWRDDWTYKDDMKKALGEYENGVAYEWPVHEH